jgi:hypothetical protein
MSETLICSHTTLGGSLVEVVHTDPDRVKSLTEVAELTGPIWRCHGCGDGSDKPLVHAAFGSPERIVDQAAAGHAATCRR